jgi:hypothetical protein
MSRAKSRAGHRRVQPYAWLGAGAVTLGMGVTLIGGAAVAVADIGGDAATTERAAASGSSASGSSASGSSATAAAATTSAEAGRAESGSAVASQTRTRPANRAARTGSVTGGRAGEATPPALSAGRNRASLQQSAPVQESAPEASPAPAAAAADPEDPMTLPVTESAGSEIEIGGSAEASTAETEPRPPAPVARRSARPAQARAALVDLAPQSAPAPEAAATASAVADSPEWISWLPGGSVPGGVNPGEQIVPGSYVALAMQEIEATQAIIQQETWGAGNVFAGVASIVPQVFLASASLSLMAWGATNPGAQGFLAATAGIPIIHQVAQVSLIGSMLLPSIAEASMGGAALFLPVVGLLGADVSAATTELASARQNGKIYAVVPTRMVSGTQPVAGVSVNGGAPATMLIDTGASGVVTTRDKIGAGDLGPKIGEGVSAFSGGLNYSYETYNLVVDFGGGAVTEPTPVNIVTDTEAHPNSVAGFKNFLSWGADGILGVGANDLPEYFGGPGPAPIPSAVLPGELKDGVLIFQGLFLGQAGVMVFGPNPLPVRVSVPGGPDAFVQVVVNDTPVAGREQMIIDSGGVYGTMSTANDPTGTPVGQKLPAGTKISVYTPDDETLLYTYFTGGGGGGTPVIAGSVMNSGNAPYAQGPVYLNYGFVDRESYGQGSTDFSIW